MRLKRFHKSIEIIYKQYSHLCIKTKQIITSCMPEIN